MKIDFERQMLREVISFLKKQPELADQVMKISHDNKLWALAVQATFAQESVALSNMIRRDTPWQPNTSLEELKSHFRE